MDRQGIKSRRELAKRVGAPPPMTINDVFSGSDPRLETVWKFATALGVSAVSLLTENGNIRQFPRYPSALGQSDKSLVGKEGDRKKRRA